MQRLSSSEQQGRGPLKTRPLTCNQKNGGQGQEGTLEQLAAWARAPR